MQHGALSVIAVQDLTPFFNSTMPDFVLMKTQNHTFSFTCDFWRSVFYLFFSFLTKLLYELHLISLITDSAFSQKDTEKVQGGCRT